MEGHVTLEFSNTTPLPAKIYANEGVAQVLFFESDEECEISYKDRGGKIPGATGCHPAQSIEKYYMSFEIDPTQRYRASDLTAFLKFVDEAIFEVDEYIFCVQEDLEDELDDLTTSLEQISAYLKQLRDNVENQVHPFSNGQDLDYMPLVRKLRHVLPFYGLLDGINHSHHQGIDQ